MYSLSSTHFLFCCCCAHIASHCGLLACALAKLSLVASCEKASLLHSVALASLLYPFFLSLYISNALTLFSKLLGNTLLETLCPLSLLLHPLLLTLLFQKQSLAVVIDLKPFRLQTFSDVLIFLSPCPVHALALASVVILDFLFIARYYFY